MEIDFLRHYGFSSPIVKTLSSAYGAHLLPLQEKVIREGGLFENQSLIVSAPTSSGKTFLAETLFLHHVLQGKNVLLLLPTKALANQRYHQWRERYAPLGYDILLSTRDHPYQDQRLLEGRFHLAIVIYEKMRSLLSRDPSFLHSLGACVVDEMHYLYHPQRGPDLELLMTQLHQVDTLQMLGLSSLLEDESLAAWLHAQWIRETQRPVELRQGVLCCGRFTYREFNSQQEGRESLPLEESHDEGLAMIEAARYFSKRGEITLLFWPSRDLCYTAARKLAREMEPLHDSLDESFSQMEETRMRRFLQKILPRGIAVHTSDLTHEERRLVERHAQAGQLQIICATTTLAEGINFPVNNVLTLKNTFGSSITPGVSSTPVPLTREQMFNMVGRAGRLGLSDFGRGMVVTCSAGDVEGLLNLYARGKGESPTPVLYRVGLNQTVLKTFPAKGYSTRERILSLLNHTLSGVHQCFDSLEEKLDSALTHLIREGFITKEQDRLYPTPIGLVVICQGLSLRSTQYLKDFLQEIAGELPHALEILGKINLVDEMLEVYSPVSWASLNSHHWTRLLHTAVKEAALRNDSSFMHFINTPQKMRREHHGAMKKTLLLYEWIQGKSLNHLEEHYQQLSGAISRLAEEASWLIGCLHDLAAAFAFPPEVLSSLNRLILRVKYGLPSEGIDWAPLLQKGFLHRSQVLYLLKAGFSSPRKIKPEDLSFLQNWLPEEIAKQFIHEQAESSDPQKYSSFMITCYEGTPNLIYLNEQEIKLSRLQTELMRRLMAKPKQCLDYEFLIDELWPNHTGSRDKLYRRRDEINKKAAMVTGGDQPPLILVAEGLGMVLNAEVKRYPGLRE